MGLAFTLKGFLYATNTLFQCQKIKWHLYTFYCLFNTLTNGNRIYEIVKMPHFNIHKWFDDNNCIILYGNNNITITHSFSERRISS